jgi:predicted secreted protein
MRFPLACLALAVTLPAPLFAQDAAPAAGAEKPAEKDKLICRRETPIGSLIATRKMCLTKTQWAERERVGNDVARQMVQDNQGRPSGN